MVRDDIVVIREVFVADGADPTLLDNLSVQQFPHLGRRPQFPISSRVVWIFDTLNSKSYDLGLRQKLPTTAGQRFMDWAELIATQSHDIPRDGERNREKVGSVTMSSPCRERFD